MSLQQATAVLFDKSLPFNEDKAKAVDIVTSVLYGREPADVFNNITLFRA